MVPEVGYKQRQRIARTEVIPMSGSKGNAVERFVNELDTVVFAFGALLTVSVIVAFFVNRSAVETMIDTAHGEMLSYMSWALLVIVFLIVIFLLFLIVGPWGKIKLGDEDPEYSFLSFFAMLYSAGFAAGVVFWGPTEGLFYYADPNPLFGVEGARVRRFRSLSSRHCSTGRCHSSRCLPSWASQSGTSRTTTTTSLSVSRRH